MYAKTVQQVSVHLQSGSANQTHRLGINALAFDDSNKWLYSGGRDSSVHCWDLSAGPQNFRHQTLFAHHSHWINDLALCYDNRILATCSSDSTVKLWKTAANPVWTSQTKIPSENGSESGLEQNTETKSLEGRSSLTSSLNGDYDMRLDSSQDTTNILLATLEGHRDYVKKIATNNRELLVSAGLDGAIYFWDLNHPLSPVCQFFDEGERFRPPECWDSSIIVLDRKELSVNNPHKPRSIYAMALSDTNRSSPLLLTGGSDCMLRAWDPRTRESAFKVKGHHDVIRQILVNAEGTRAITCSSDSTVKVWEIGQQRSWCLKTYASLHNQSCWSMAIDPSFTRLFSAGKDQEIVFTDLSTASSVLLFKEESPVLSMLLPPDESSLWVATNQPNLHNWNLDGKFAQRRLISDHHISTSPKPKSFMLSQSETLQDPHYTSGPSFAIKGSSAIKKFHILNNKQQLLTQDAEGFVQLWSVTHAKKIKDYGVVDWEEAITNHFVMISVPSWFSVDISLGSVVIHLDPSTVFNSLIDQFDVIDSGISSENVEFVNLGEKMLWTLFRFWVDSKFHNDLEIYHSIQDKLFLDRQHLRELEQALSVPQTNLRSQSQFKLQSQTTPSSTAFQPQTSFFDEQKPESSPQPDQQKTTDPEEANAPEPEPEHEKPTEKEPSLPSTPTTSDSDLNPPEPAPASPRSTSSTSSTSAISSAKPLTYNEKRRLYVQKKYDINETEKQLQRRKEWFDLRKSKLKKTFFPIEEDVTVVIADKNTGSTFSRQLIRQFRYTDNLPEWVKTCLVNGEVPTRESAEMAVIVRCSDSRFVRSEMKFKAPKAFRLNKIISKIIESSKIDLPASSEDPSVKILPEDFAELLFEDKVLDPHLTVHTVKTFFSKRSELHLELRCKEAFKEPQRTSR